MRRLLAVGIGLLAIGAFVAAGPTGSEDDDQYLVRAVFDNGSFIVPGEDVRIAGANAGVVDSIDVSLPGEQVSDTPGEEDQDGKAVVVLNITDPAFQDFRRDASCILRPQSLIGERYVACRPSRPRPIEDPQPPPLERIPDGEPGAGQYLLPLENNGKTVDIDLVTNVMRMPTRERLRLILNDLGATFAARGDEIAEIVRRADPTLRDGDRVLAILAHQRRQLADLATNSERILAPLSRERDHVAGFIDNAGETAAATAERRADLEQALARFPGFLRELRGTMAKFQGFSNAALPVAAELGRAAPSLTDATRALSPFAKASTVGLTSLGDAAEASGPKFAAADPIVRKARDLAQAGERPTTDLAALLSSTRRTKGFEGLMDLIYNTTGSVNGFDDAGHFLRTSLVATNCVDYSVGWASGCDARFEAGAGKGPPIANFPLITGDGGTGDVSTPPTAKHADRDRTDDERTQPAPPTGGIELGPPRPTPEPTNPGVTATPGASTVPQSTTTTPDPSADAAPDAQTAPVSPQPDVSPRAMKDLLNLLVGR